MHNAPTGDAGSVTQDCIEAQPNDSATAAEYEGSCPPFLAPVTERSVGASYENRGHRLSHHRRRDAAEGAGAHQDVRMPVYRPQKVQAGGVRERPTGVLPDLKSSLAKYGGPLERKAAGRERGGGCQCGLASSASSGAK
jgi:hypothetical protein